MKPINIKKQLAFSARKMERRLRDRKKSISRERNRNKF